MSGKSEGYKPSFHDIYNKQIEFQNIVTKIKSLPVDDVKYFSYHMQAMIEELGEVLCADKRWKTHRNNKLDLDNKKEELMDVLITCLNLLIFTGMDSNEILVKLEDKILKNMRRIGHG